MPGMAISALARGRPGDGRDCARYGLQSPGASFCLVVSSVFFGHYVLFLIFRCLSSGSLGEWEKNVRAYGDHAPKRWYLQRSCFFGQRTWPTKPQSTGIDSARVSLHNVMQRMFDGSGTRRAVTRVHVFVYKDTGVYSVVASLPLHKIIFHVSCVSSYFNLMYSALPQYNRQ